MPCNFKSWPAKEITLADRKSESDDAATQNMTTSAGFSVYATFDPCFLMKTTSVGMQILTPVHFLPVFSLVDKLLFL